MPEDAAPQLSKAVERFQTPKNEPPVTHLCGRSSKLPAPPQTLLEAPLQPPADRTSQKSPQVENGRRLNEYYLSKCGRHRKLVAGSVACYCWLHCCWLANSPVQKPICLTATVDQNYLFDSRVQAKRHWELRQPSAVRPRLKTAAGKTERGHLVEDRFLLDLRWNQPVLSYQTVGVWQNLLLTGTDSDQGRWPQNSATLDWNLLESVGFDRGLEDRQRFDLLRTVPMVNQPVWQRCVPDCP